MYKANTVVFSGRLTHKPVVSHTDGKKPYTVFHLAQNDNRANKPFFHKIVAFGENAEKLAAYEKGQLVNLVTLIRYNKYTDGPEYIVIDICDD